jgi:glycosyltransferase involved in cell wall biosynthesis
MDKPLVSVIIIFLNEERFIREAIEGVFAQTYEHWELLLVDDGSTDSSTAIAKTYSEQQPEKICYLEHEHHENRGMSASRNLGIRHARGKYIALVDADDVWLPDKLDNQVAILARHPSAAMVCGPVQWWYSWTGQLEDSGRDFVSALNTSPDTMVEPPELLIPLLSNETATTTPGLFRREIVNTVGGFEECFRGLYEDQAFFAKICSKSQVYVASQCWYRWRKHPTSSCSVAVNDGKYHIARFRFLTWLEKYLSSQNVKNRRVWRELHKQMRRYRYPRWDHVISKAYQFFKRSEETLRKIGRRTLPPSARGRIKEVYCVFPRGKQKRI